MPDLPDHWSWVTDRRAQVYRPRHPGSNDPVRCTESFILIAQERIEKYSGKLINDVRFPMPKEIPYPNENRCVDFYDSALLSQAEALEKR